MIEAHFKRLAPRYGLQGKDVTVEYRYFGGSLERRHYAISGGEAEYHLKLAHIPDHLARLRKWHSLGRTLHERFRAPRIVDWIDVPGPDFSGLLFEHIHGHVWDFGEQPRLAPEVIDLVHRLHEDKELQRELRRFTPGGACSDYFNSVWRRRIRRDLPIVEKRPPAFVAGDTLRWMREESLKIEAAAADMEAFSHPAASPVHGDLWPGNILVTEDGSLRIIDWDDLALGDPALDFAVLLDPVLGGDLESSIAGLLPFRPDAAFLERMEVCLRAQRLYRAIEAPAEYLEAEALGASTDSLRNEKRLQHQEAESAYRRMYSGG